MLLRVAADSVVLLHLGFIVFVILGGFLVICWRRFIWLHLPAVVWGSYIELTGGVCPLTPLENRLRRAAGDMGYTGGFIEHYLMPIIYPGALTRRVQIALGVAVVAVNVAVYSWIFVRKLKKMKSSEP